MKWIFQEFLWTTERQFRRFLPRCDEVGPFSAICVLFDCQCPFFQHNTRISFVADETRLERIADSGGSTTSSVTDILVFLLLLIPRHLAYAICHTCPKTAGFPERHSFKCWYQFVEKRKIKHMRKCTRLENDGNFKFDPIHKSLSGSSTNMFYTCA